MDELKAVIVQCGNEEYAISVETIVSIERLEKVNPIPHLPGYLLGLMRIREELVPILDFEQILYGNSAVGRIEARVVVVQTEKLHMGLLVIDAKEILDIPSSALKNLSLMTSNTPYFTSVANLEDRMITIVDPEILSQTLVGIDEIGTYVETQLKEEVKSS